MERGGQEGQRGLRWTKRRIRQVVWREDGRSREAERGSIKEWTGEKTTIMKKPGTRARERKARRTQKQKGGRAANKKKSCRACCCCVFFSRRAKGKRRKQSGGPEKKQQRCSRRHFAATVALAVLALGVGGCEGVGGVGGVQNVCSCMRLTLGYDVCAYKKNNNPPQNHRTTKPKYLARPKTTQQSRGAFTTTALCHLPTQITAENVNGDCVRRGVVWIPDSQLVLVQANPVAGVRCCCCCY
jgi:hypothetical protein